MVLSKSYLPSEELQVHIYTDLPVEILFALSLLAELVNAISFSKHLCM